MLVSGICTKPGERAIVYACYTIALSPGLAQIPLTSIHYRSLSWLRTDTTNKHTLSLSLSWLGTDITNKHTLSLSLLGSKAGVREIVYAC
jgi:hypothetical protein